ncbi:MAG: ATP-dependent RecD-like DNA helicase [Bacteroidia bacterium]
MELVSRIYEVFKSYFPFEPTTGQNETMYRVSEFLADKSQKIFVLAGYAGTGKTTLVSALVELLPHIKYKSVLLAPTGRAAKVLSNYSHKKAFTIHKYIYFTAGDESEVYQSFSIKPNKNNHTIFIVDEASMIGDNGSEYNLLEDLISFVFEGIDCKLILIGDSAQLPPVGATVSPALNVKQLEKDYHIPVKWGVLKDVMRQEQNSGILFNATQLRLQIKEKNVDFRFILNGFNDIKKISGLELQDELNSCYSKYGYEDTLVITRNNKRANLYNHQIRARIRYFEEELSAGDLLMVVKNNYFWIPPKSGIGFIANGDTIEIQKVKNIYDLYGFRFAEVRIVMPDYEDIPSIDVTLLLDTINSETPALSNLQQQELYNQVMLDLMLIPDKSRRYRELKKNPYYNALQVKFAYSVTCHKAQGGQWKAVFIDQGYLNNDMLNIEYLRWLYTAITRATEKVYLVNFDEKFFN